jgi:hypothetical protein
MRLLRALKNAVWRCRHGLLATVALSSLAGLIGWLVVHATAPSQLTAVDPALFVPDEARCVVQIRVADLLRSDFGKTWMEHLPTELDNYGFGPTTRRTFERELEQNFALDAHNVETWVVATNSAPLELEILTPTIVTRLGGYDSPFRNLGPAGPGTGFATTAGGKYQYPTMTIKKTAAKTVPQTAPPAAPANGAAQATPGTGSGDAPPPSVDHLLDRHPLSIFTMTKPNALDRARNDAARLQMQMYLGRTLYVSAVGGTYPTVFFPDARTMVVGPLWLIKRAIKQQEDGAKPSPRAAVLRKHDDRHIVIDALFRPSKEGFGEETTFSNVRQLAPLSKAKGKLSVMDFGNEFLLERRYHFDEETKADKAIPALKEWLNAERLFMVGRFLGSLDKALPRATDPKQDEALTVALLFFEQLEAALREPNVKRDGKNLLLTLRVKSDFKTLTKEAAVEVKKRWTPEKIAEMRIQRAKMDVKRIEQAVLSYKVNYKKYPQTLNELTQRQPNGDPAFLKAETLFDPWGNQYVFEPGNLHPDTAIPRIYSVGEPGKKQPISNWDVK